MHRHCRPGREAGTSRVTKQRTQGARLSGPGAARRRGARPRRAGVERGAQRAGVERRAARRGGARTARAPGRRWTGRRSRRSRGRSRAARGAASGLSARLAHGAGSAQQGSEPASRAPTAASRTGSCDTGNEEASTWRSPQPLRPDQLPWLPPIAPGRACRAGSASLVKRWRAGSTKPLHKRTCPRALAQAHAPSSQHARPPLGPTLWQKQDARKSTALARGKSRKPREYVSQQNTVCARAQRPLSAPPPASHTAHACSVSCPAVPERIDHTSGTAHRLMGKRHARRALEPQPHILNTVAGRRRLGAPPGSGAAHQQGLQQAARARRPQVQAAGQVRGLLQEGRIRAADHARIDDHVAALRAQARGGTVMAGEARRTGEARRRREFIEQARLLCCTRQQAMPPLTQLRSDEVLRAGVIPAGSAPKAPVHADREAAHARRFGQRRRMDGTV